VEMRWGASRLEVSGGLRFLVWVWPRSPLETSKVIRFGELDREPPKLSGFYSMFDVKIVVCLCVCECVSVCVCVCVCVGQIDYMLCVGCVCRLRG
jgi:hypothetical protein